MRLSTTGVTRDTLTGETGRYIVSVMSKRDVFIRSVDATAWQAFKVEAVQRGMTHGELLAELVTRKVEK